MVQLGVKTYIGAHAKTFGRGRALLPEEFKSILECIKATENHTFDSERKIWYIPQTEFNIRMLTIERIFTMEIIFTIFYFVLVFPIQILYGTSILVYVLFV